MRRTYIQGPDGRAIRADGLRKGGKLPYCRGSLMRRDKQRSHMGKNPRYWKSEFVGRERGGDRRAPVRPILFIEVDTPFDKTPGEVLFPERLR